MKILQRAYPRNVFEQVSDAFASIGLEISHHNKLFCHYQFDRKPICLIEQVPHSREVKIILSDKSLGTMQRDESEFNDGVMIVNNRNDVRSIVRKLKASLNDIKLE